MSEPEGRGAAWTEERATQERATREGGASEGAGEAGGAPQASRKRGQRRAGGAVLGPTFAPSQAESGWLAARNPATCCRAAAVPSQGSSGHSFQVTMPLYRRSPIRGWSAG